MAADGLMVHHGLGLYLRTGRWFLRSLGSWAARKWWPTPRMLAAVQVESAAPTNSPNEGRPNVRINLGAHEIRWGLGSHEPDALRLGGCRY